MKTTDVLSVLLFVLVLKKKKTNTMFLSVLVVTATVFIILLVLGNCVHGKCENKKPGTHTVSI